MKTRYLVPLDGSELGEHSLPWAKSFASRTDKRVELLRCHDPLASVYTMAPEFATTIPDVDYDAYHAEIDEYLATIAKEFDEGVTIVGRREGDAANIILERCESGEIEMVFLTTHGRGGLGRWLLGSVATKVVRGSRRPVFVVNAATEVPDQIKVNKILVPLDGSTTSEIAIPQAIQLSKTFDGAQLTLYRAIPKNARDSERLEADRYLRGLREIHPNTNILTIVDRVQSLNPALTKLAQSYDVVVLSSHGRSGVKRWLLGSVTEKLIQTVNKPLLIVYKRGKVN